MVVEVVFFGESPGTELALEGSVLDVGPQVFPEGLHVDELLFAYVALVGVSFQFFVGQN